MIRAGDRSDQSLRIQNGVALQNVRMSAPSFDWSSVDAAVDAIPAGHWTTFKDLAKLGNTHPKPTGQHLIRSFVPNAYRALKSNGTIPEPFTWNDPRETRDPRQRLIEEGLGFSASGRADPSRRLSAADLQRLSRR